MAGTAPSPRSRHTAAFVGRRMFVLFGGDDSRVYNDVHVYDAGALYFWFFVVPFDL